MTCNNCDFCKDRESVDIRSGTVELTESPQKIYFRAYEQDFSFITKEYAITIRGNAEVTTKEANYFEVTSSGTVLNPVEIDYIAITHT